MQGKPQQPRSHLISAGQGRIAHETGAYQTNRNKVMNEQTITIPSSILTAARVFTANSKENRVQLQGVHFDFRNNCVEAATGHYAIRIPYEFNLDRDSILYRIPKGGLAETCEINLDTDTLTATEGKLASDARSYVLERIDAKFVDLDKVMPERERELTCGDFRVDASYMAILSKAFPKHTPLRVMVSSNDSALEIQPLPHDESLVGARVLIMPMLAND